MTYTRGYRDGIEAAAKVAEGEVYKERYRAWSWWPALDSQGSRGNQCNDSAITKHSDDIAKAIRSLPVPSVEFRSAPAAISAMNELCRQKDEALCSKEAELVRLAERVAKLEARLEIDHCYRIVDGEMVRKEIPASERDGFPDAVACRDATIHLLEDDVKKLRAALEDETDACAEIAENIGIQARDYTTESTERWCKKIAAAIRARKEGR